MVSFLRRGKRTAGIDVGSGFIKICVVDHSGPQPELVNVSYTPQVTDAIVDGEIMDPQLVVDTLRTLLEGTEMKTRSTVASVGGRDVIIKKIQVDRMAEEEARDLIRWEAQNYVPFDMEDVQLDFQILDPEGDGVQMNVLLVAAKRDLVSQRVGLLRDAGASPSVVDVDAFALHNAFEYNYPDVLEGTVALVNVGHELSTVNVLQNGVPTLTRDIPFGSRRLREALRRGHGLSSEEADQVLHGKSDRVSEYLPDIRENAEELASGVDRAAGFLSMGGGDAVLDRVYLTGGGARIPGVLELVAERVSVPTEIASPLQRLRVRSELRSAFPFDELAPMLMLPIGLALRA